MENKIHVPNHQMIDGYIMENTIVLDPIDIQFLRYNIVDIMDYTGYVVAWYMFNPYFPFCLAKLACVGNNPVFFNVGSTSYGIIVYPMLCFGG
jgi:hypothetical protein